MNSKRSSDSIVTQRHCKVTPSRHSTIDENTVQVIIIKFS